MSDTDLSTCLTPLTPPTASATTVKGPLRKGRRRHTCRLHKNRPAGLTQHGITQNHMSRAGLCMPRDVWTRGIGGDSPGLRAPTASTDCTD